MKYNYKRRKSHEVKIGTTAVGGSNPIRLQSMTNTSTNDIEGSVAQILRIVEEGGEIVRLTTQGVREADSLGEIRARVRKTGCDVPLVADVHFNPRAAFRAAETAEKVRINPGNFVDAARTFQKLSYTDEEYAAEIEKIRRQLVPFLEKCKKNGAAVRLGVNHGSLSDRIMSRYGDTPAGMVESVMEFLRICREEGFDDVVISVKASNTAVMTETVKLFCAEMDKEGMDYPLHLGVTEAGDGEDGRIKSAAGIGALLAEGIGDTIRVSLSEPPENEIPVAARLRDYILQREGHRPIEEPETVLPGNERDYAVAVTGHNGAAVALHNDFETIPSDFHQLTTDASPENPGDDRAIILSTDNANRPGAVAAWIDRLRANGSRNPVIVNLRYNALDPDDVMLQAAADFGALLLNGYASGISVETDSLTPEECGRLELDILQATRRRMTKTEYISCPGCGRTLFDLQATLAEVKRATAGLPALKIGVMGCIVNGPGEMADADYGYVGAGPGRVSIYKGKKLIHKNVESEKALPLLLELIRADRDNK